MKWGTIIPLIGGSALGCKYSTGADPEFHLSYSAFSQNETHLDRYMPGVPKYLIDSAAPAPQFEEVSYVNSVCPCAGLSMLNTMTRGASAAQNRWLYESSEYVLEHVKPRVLWGENAPGLFTSLGEEVAQRLAEIGQRYGYSFSMVKTNTQLHGIPQRRFRTFYFFWDSPTAPILNWKSRAHIDLVEYLQQIPESATLQDMYINPGPVTEHFRPYEFVLEKLGMSHKDFAAKYKKLTVAKFIHSNGWTDECIAWLRAKYPTDGFSLKKETQSFADILIHQKEKLSQGKGFWDSSPHFYDGVFAPVISRNMFNGVHPVENRYLNVREMLHLMGMPHDFEIDKIDNVNHLAQNVPVQTARDWADEVKKYINGELKPSAHSFLRQDNTTQKIIEPKQVISKRKFIVHSVI